jgi:hypothetical protein
MTAGVANPSGAGGIVALAEAEATALFARGGFSTARRERINRYIRQWKQAGCWPHVTGLWFFAAESRDQALLNWAAAGSEAILAGSPEPTFTANKGFSGLTPTKLLRVPWTPSGLGGNDFGLAFAGLIDASLTVSGDGGDNNRILTAETTANVDLNPSILTMSSSPIMMAGMLGNRPDQRLSTVSRQQWAALGVTSYGPLRVGATGLPAGYIRNSVSTTRIGILNRWAGIAILKATISDVQTRAFARIWDNLVAESGALD